MARKTSKSADATSNSFYRASRLSFGVVAGGIFEIIIIMIPYPDTSAINSRIIHDVAGAFLLLLLLAIAGAVAGFFINFLRSATPASSGLIALAFSIAAGIFGAIELRKAIPGLKLIFGTTKVKVEPTLLVGQIQLKPLMIVMIVALVAVGSITMATVSSSRRERNIEAGRDRLDQPRQRQR